MIIIGFGAGLGNQMFQYAFYLSMKRRYPQVEFKADMQYAFANAHNGIEIDKVFGIKLTNCTLRERKKLSEIPLKRTIITRAVGKIRNTIGIHKKSFYHQPDNTEFFSEVYNFSAHDDKYLLGVWANEEYFRSLKDELQTQSFIFKLPLNERSKEYKQHILNTESVSIHVRKGDFVQCENHIMSKRYYSKAMEYIESHLQCEIQYFVFSDDMEYAKELFCDILNAEFVVGNNGNDSWMDMYLMSLCKHNIIANSSFSFWGAYLNRNEDKIVIASNKPFRGCKNPFTCMGWVTLDED